MQPKLGYTVKEFKQILKSPGDYWEYQAEEAKKAGRTDDFETCKRTAEHLRFVEKNIEEWVRRAGLPGSTAPDPAPAQGESPLRGFMGRIARFSPFKDRTGGGGRNG